MMMRCQRCPFFIVLPSDFPYLPLSRFEGKVLKGQQVERRRKPRETDGAVALNWEIICFLPSVYLAFVNLKLYCSTKKSL